MSVKLIKENNAYNSLVKQYICEEVDDLDEIEDPEFGSMALILDGFKIYVCDSEGSWVSDSGSYTPSTK